MNPGSRVIYSRQWLKSVGFDLSHELQPLEGELLEFDHDGFARVRWDHDPNVRIVLAENLAPAVQRVKPSWVPPRLRLVWSSV
jgi:hypothetical protein